MLKNSLLLLLASAVISGCAHYQPRPLSHQHVLERYEKFRGRDSGEAALTFDRAQRLMDENNRRLKEIRQEYLTMKHVADIPTPWPNPAVATGFKHGYDLPNDFSSATQPFVSLAFTVPLTSRIRQQDDVNAVLAQQKATELKTGHRRLYLELRRIYGTLYLLQRKEAILNQLTDFVQWKLDEMRNLMDSGVYSPLDLAVVTQQRHLVEQQRLSLQTEILKAIRQLAVLLDLPVEFLAGRTYESLSFADASGAMFTPEDLLANHLNLANLRAGYEVAEKRLRLEITKQYPDLQIGGAHNREPGENKRFHALTIGIKLPVFDRNQVGISRAAGKRDEMLTAYEKEVANALISAASLRKQYQNESRRQRHLDQSVVQQAEKSRDIAREAFKSDQISLLRYWDFEEELIEQQLKSAENMIRLWRQHAELELLLGKPLI